MSVTGGFPPYTWTASPESPFSGLTFDRPDGILAGAPEAFGETTVNIGVADRSGQSLQVDFPLRVRPPLMPVQILTKNAPTGRAQADYHVALSAVGGLSPYRWKLEGGSLPPGLTLDEPSGVISGKPEQAGDYAIRLSVADAEGTPAPAPVELPLEIRTWKNLRPLIVTTRSVPTLLKGRPSEVALACEGGEPPYSWSVSSEMPAGLRLDGGRIIGTPSAAAALATTFRVMDASGETASQSLTLTVEHVAPFWLAVLLAILATLALLFLIWLLLRYRKLTAAARAPLSIITQEIPAARASCWYSVQLACQGGMPPYRWRLSRGELPPGIELSESGVISGYPFRGINVDARKSVPITVRVEDARGQHADAEL
jgi:hypothetical protein